MNRKIVTIFLVAFLFIEGAISILAEEEPAAGDVTNDYGSTEPQPTGSHLNPCGEGGGNGPGIPG